MMTRDHGFVVFECDLCSDIFETNQTDFVEATRLLREAEWESRKINGEWNHFCQDCRRLA